MSGSDDSQRDKLRSGRPAPASEVRPTEAAKIVKWLTYRSDEGRARVAVVSGMAGVGKTTLALQVGRNLARSTDRELVVVDGTRLQSYREPAKHLWARLASALEDSSNGIVVVLDDLDERGMELLGDTSLPPSCSVIATTRRSARLPDAANIVLAPLPLNEALDMLKAELNQEALQSTSPSDLEQVATVLNGLPLAITVFAANANNGTHSTLELLRDLQDRSLSWATPLSLVERLLSAVDSPDQRIVLAAVAIQDATRISVQMLEDALARRVLDVEATVAKIVTAGMLVEQEPGHFSFSHDLVRASVLQAFQSEFAQLEAAHYLSRAGDIYSSRIKHSLELLDSANSGQALEETYDTARLVIERNDILALLDLYLRRSWWKRATRLADLAGDFLAEQDLAPEWARAKEVSLSAGEQTGDTRRTFRELLLLGRYYAASGASYYDAHHYLLRAEQLVDDPEGKLKLFDEEWSIFMQAKLYASAVACAERELNFRTAMEDGSVVIACERLSVSYFWAGEFQDAIEAGERAARLARAIGATDVEARSLLLVARCFLETGETSAAMPRIAQSLKLSRGNENIYTHSAYWMGYSFSLLGRWSDSEKWFREALRRSRDDDDLGEPLAGLAHSLLMQERVVEAREVMDRRLLAARKQRGSKLEIARALLDIGELDLSQDNPSEQAGQLLEEAIGIFERSSDTVGLLKAITSLGHFHLMSHQAEHAIGLYQRALAIDVSATDSINAMGKASALNGLGYAYNEVGQALDSVRAYEDAIEAARTIPQLGIELDSLNGLLQALEAAGLRHEILAPAKRARYIASKLGKDVSQYDSILNNSQESKP